MSGLHYISGVGNGEKAAADALLDARARSDHKDIAFYESILKTYKPREHNQHQALIGHPSKIDLSKATLPEREAPVSPALHVVGMATFVGLVYAWSRLGDYVQRRFDGTASSKIT